MKWKLILFFIHIYTVIADTLTNSCTYEDFLINYYRIILENGSQNHSNIYITYEVNPSEGFNLRRDVYIRMAVFIKNLKRDENFKSVKLVLPPFTKLFHWKSRDIDQNLIPWKHFFDLESLSKFTDVIDYDSFLDEIGLNFEQSLVVDQIFQLQHFKEMFENGVFIDKFKIENCNKNTFNLQPFRDKWNFIERKFSCLKFQGTTRLLQKVINFAFRTIQSRPAIIMFLNTEIVLHEQWGSQQFWMARRSMRFNKNLVSIANDFRLKNFNSTNELDLVQRPVNWQHEINYRNAKGGQFLCAHLRRGDFLYGRDNLLPTLKSVAIQVQSKFNELPFKKIFLTSDCSEEEYKEFSSYFNENQVYRFKPKEYEVRNKIKDGGIAIVDQIICAHAGYFVGTFESTFTYRIQEEREILGFRKSLTFNTFCKNEDLSNCQRNSIWPIVY